MEPDDVIPAPDTESQVVADAPVEDPAATLAANPNWSELFDKVPAGLHQMMVPALSKWDKNFQDVQTKFSPYKDFAEKGVDPQEITAALELLNLAKNDPRSIYDQMGQAFGEEWGLNTQQAQQQQQVQGDPAESFNLDEGQSNPWDGMNIEDHPRFKELANNQDVLANFLASQVQAEEQRNADAQLDAEIRQLGIDQLPGEAQTYIFSVASTGKLDLAQSLAQYQSLETGIRSRPVPGQNFPSVVSPSGGIPSSAVDVGSLSSKDTRGLVASFLKQANQGD